MKESKLLKTLSILFIWMICISESFGQDKITIPEDTLWVFIPAPDSLRSDTVPQRGNRTADYTFDVKIPEFQYKSPEASAFKKYGDYQVNEYNGNPDIRVPLYMMSYKDIEIPIELNYDASGIKVEQEASWVGLGWNLMVGGCINYVISGSIDPKSFNATQTAWENFLATGSGDFYQFTTGLEDNSYLRLDIKSGHGERDYFSVNILGKTFLFTFNPFTYVTTVIGKDSEKYKVEITNLSGNNIYEQLNNANWKITDADGYQYYFSPGEQTNAYVTTGVYTSTWNLTQIITPEGSVVDFSYCNAIPVNYHAYRGEQYDILSNSSNASNYPTPGYSSQMLQTNVSVQTRYLTSVETRDQRINFTLGDRTDMVNAKKLTKISVYSKISQQTIKEFNFSYGDFSASTTGGNYLNDQQTISDYPPELGLRLKLNSVTETAGTTSLTTSFTYNSTLLPLKTSCSKDFWGYYNYQGNNGYSPITNAHTLLPTPLPLFINSGIQLTDIYRSLKGANRYCNGSYMQAAILTRITYPTKGYTTFTYEPNKFVSTTTRYPTTSEYSSNVVSADLTDSNVTGQITYKQLNLTENTYGMITIYFSGNLNNLKNAGAGVTITPQNPNMGTAQVFNLSSVTNLSGSSYTLTQPIDLLGTSYMMNVNCPNSLGTGYSVHAVLSAVQAFTANNVPVSTGGGLRIQSIKNYHHDGTLQYYTNYEYTDDDGNCTGKLLQPFSFSESWQIICAYQVPGCSDPGCINTYSYNLHRLEIPSTDVPVFFNSLAGGTVGYSTVRKLSYNGNGDLLSTVRTDYINDLPKWKNNIHYFMNDSNGLVKSQTITDPVSGKVMRKRFTYSHENQKIRCNAIVYDRIRDFTDWGYNIPSRYNVRIYPFYISWSKLATSKESTYYGSDSLVINKTYTYNSQNHKVRRETENASNTNISYITEYKYPVDYQSSPYNQMSNSTYHMLNPIIERNDSAIEGGTKKLIKRRKDTYMGFSDKYRDAAFNSKVFLLTSSSFALNGGSLESRLSFVYNNKCDRISITKDTEKVTYLWAYNYMYPVAEIRGATYSDLSDWGLSTNISNLATMTSTSNVSSALATIRSSLASRPVLMTSYTYDPLISITSMTAPNGTKTTYTYDAMGRLSSVKNHGGSIIQQHSYNYKTN